MDVSEFNIHFQGKETPKVKVDKYNDFSIVEILAENNQSIKLFFYRPHQVTNFKNNLLSSHERPRIIEK